jgi:hypothetical protein
MSFGTRTGLLLAGAALGLAATGPATAATDDEIAALRAQIRSMQQRLDELEAKQDETEDEVEAAKEGTLSAGSMPGRYKLPGSDTEIEIGGYVKADVIYDVDESVGDLFVTENISTRDGDDESGVRLHARQSRLFVKTYTPTEWGELTTHIEGDFFGNGGNEVFSNSYSFRLRHATATIGPLRVGQYWTNFMPIESYPATVDFQGPAGIPFIRQTQIRYTHDLDDNLSLSASLENSEFSGKGIEGGDLVRFEESDATGIRAGIDKGPDLVGAARYRDDWGLLKLAGVARWFGSPDDGDGDFGWGLNLSGHTELWAGGKALGSVTYGDGVGRYIVNGRGQDGIVDADGDVAAVTSWGLTAGLSQDLTDELTAAVAYGRFQVEDQVALGADLANTNSVHTSLFWNPLDRLTIGGEVMWGNREDEDGTSDDALRVQSAVQVNF